MTDPAVTIALRIPGTWSHPKELIARLPAGCRLTGEALLLPDNTSIDFGAALTPPAAIPATPKK